jgi:hypothetical protein
MLQRVNPLDFRQDLDARVLALADLDRVPLIEKLIGLDAQAQARARAGRRVRRGSIVRMRADEAFAESERLGRIIFFLRFRLSPDHATANDLALCDALAAKLAAKGQWSGDYSL